MEPRTLPAGAIVLRPHLDKDIDGVLDQCQDPATQAWTTIPVPYTREHAEQFIRQVVPDGWRDGTYLAFAIADARSDEFLGTIDLRPSDGGRAEVGFGLRSKARGRGLMGTAARTLLDWAFASDGLGLGVVHWQAVVGNWASRRVAWATGFRMEGTIRGFGSSRGERRDMWVGSLLASDRRLARNPWFDVPTLNGSVCVLRRFRDADARACVEGCSDPQTRHWIGGLPDPYTYEAALGYIQSREEEHASGLGIYWAAADPETDRMIGAFALMDVNASLRSAEVGYWMHPAARGRGVATDAVRVLVRHASIPVDEGGLGLRRLTLRAAAGNVGSQRVAAKAGFTATGTSRSAELLGDQTFDDLVNFDILLK
ncbi:GNAT family N-acetyltransferase [Flindersiella endophytica]